MADTWVGWSITQGSNTPIGANTPSDLHDQLQLIKAQIKQNGGIYCHLTSAAGTDTYAVTPAAAITAYVDGQMYNFRADVANTGPATLNIDTVAAWDIKKIAGAALVALDTGDIIANQVCYVVADTTASAFVLINPSLGGGYIDYSAISTIVGWASFTTKKLNYVRQPGKTIDVYFQLVGTSNATTVTFTVPDNLAAGLNVYAQLYTSDASGIGYGGYCVMAPGSNIVTVYLNFNANAWTASGTKAIVGQFRYVAA